MSSQWRTILLGLLAMLSIGGCPELEGQTQIVVTVRSDLDALAASALDRWGRIDILAANAGIYPVWAMSRRGHPLVPRNPI